MADDEMVGGESYNSVLGAEMPGKGHMRSGCLIVGVATNQGGAVPLGLLV